jgi:hypothetical protein
MEGTCLSFSDFTIRSQDRPDFWKILKRRILTFADTVP